MEKTRAILLAVVLCLACAFCAACSGGNSSSSGASSDAQAVEYDYTLGVLNPVMGSDGERAVPEFKVSGVIFIRDRHNDEAEQFAVGYRNSGIADEFYRGENIKIYLDDAACGLASETTEIVALPHHEMDEYSSMDVSGIEQAALDAGGFIIPLRSENVIVEDGFNLVGEGFVNGHATPGDWDILFMKDGKVSDYVCVNTTVELKERGL